MPPVNYLFLKDPLMASTSYLYDAMYRRYTTTDNIATAARTIIKMMTRLKAAAVWVLMLSIVSLVVLSVLGIASRTLVEIYWPIPTINPMVMIVTTSVTGPIPFMFMSIFSKIRFNTQFFLSCYSENLFVKETI